MTHNGYFTVAISTFIISAVILFTYIQPKTRIFDALPLQSWRLFAS